MHSDSTRKHVRIVLYLTPLARERLEGEARERATRAGVDVTPEAAARALLYGAVGLSADGTMGVTTGRGRQQAFDAFGMLVKELALEVPGVEARLAALLKGRGMPASEIKVILDQMELSNGE